MIHFYKYNKKIKVKGLKNFLKINHDGVLARQMKVILGLKWIYFLSWSI